MSKSTPMAIPDKSVWLVICCKVGGRESWKEESRKVGGSAPSTYGLWSAGCQRGPASGPQKWQDEGANAPSLKQRGL